MKQARGFTLLELMIVVGIIAILAALALSGYRKQVLKSHRAEAKQVVSNIALGEEKYRTDHNAYQTNVATVLSGGSPSLSYYTVAVASPATGPCNDAASTVATSANSYAITATATASSGQTDDAGCTAIVLTSLCGQVTKTPTACW